MEEKRENRDDLMTPARNRNLTDVNMLFSQQWYDAIKIEKERLIEAKEKQKFYYDKTAKRVDFKIGERILFKQLAILPEKFNMRWEGPYTRHGVPEFTRLPYTVVEKKRNVSYKIISDDGKRLVVVHADRIKNSKAEQALRLLTL
jgi:hypothetical protein